MLSAWFKYTDLYLAQGLALLKVGARPADVVDLPTTLPWDKALVRVGETLQHVKASAPVPKGLRVMLSGGLCPPVPIQAPQEARSWEDLQQLLPLSASAALSVQADRLESRQEFSGQPLGMASSTNFIQALQTWAEESKLKIQGIQPSWSVASQSRLARAKQVEALQISEHDGTTLLVSKGAEWLCAHIDSTGNHAQAGVRRYLTGWDVNEENLLKLGFEAASIAPSLEGFTSWAGHWRKV